MNQELFSVIKDVSRRNPLLAEAVIAMYNSIFEAIESPTTSKVKENLIRNFGENTNQVTAPEQIYGLAQASGIDPTMSEEERAEIESNKILANTATDFDTFGQLSEADLNLTTETSGEPPLEDESTSPQQSDGLPALDSTETKSALKPFDGFNPDELEDDLSGDQK